VHLFIAATFDDGEQLVGGLRLSQILGRAAKLEPSALG
jgi:hypothetical protein